MTVSRAPNQKLPDRPGDWRAYYDGYGGFRKLLRSGYLHAALLLTVVSVGRWTQEGWWDDPIGVLPNMLGFSISGYAVLLAFGDAPFRNIIAGRSAKGDDSPFIVMNASFVHFMVVQVVALLAAFLCKNTFFELTRFGLDETSFIARIVATLTFLRFVCWGIGYALFLYSLSTALAAAMAVFNLARWYDEMITLERSTPRHAKPKPPPEQPGS